MPKYFNLCSTVGFLSSHSYQNSFGYSLAPKIFCFLSSYFKFKLYKLEYGVYRTTYVLMTDSWPLAVSVAIVIRGEGGVRKM